MPLPAERDDHEPRGQKENLKPEPALFPDAIPQLRTMLSNSDKLAKPEQATVHRTAAEILSEEYVTDRSWQMRKSPFRNPKAKSADSADNSDAKNGAKDAGKLPSNDKSGDTKASTARKKDSAEGKSADTSSPDGKARPAERKPADTNSADGKVQPAEGKSADANSPDGKVQPAERKTADESGVRKLERTNDSGSEPEKGSAEQVPAKKEKAEADNSKAEKDNNQLPELLIEDNQGKDAGKGAIDFSAMVPSIKDAGSRATKELSNWFDKLGSKVGELADAVQKLPMSLNAADGGSWKRADGSWTYSDKSGKTSEKYSAKVSDVSSDGAGNTTVKLADGRSIKENVDGSVLEYNAADKLSSIKYKDGSSRTFEWSGDDLVKMTSKTGEWTRGKDEKGNVKDEWTPKGSTSPWAGEIKLDQKSGELKIAGTTYRSDASVEKTNADGTREVKFANSDSVKYDKDGRVTELTTQESRRIFSWTENPSAKNENEKQVLSGIQVIKDGKNYFHTRQSDGSWNVQTYENNAWSAAQAEKISFAVNNKTGEYSYEENGAKHVISGGKGEKETRPDGSVLEYQNSQLVKATQGNSVREFEWKDKQLVSVRDSAQNKNWTSVDGKWQSDKGDKQVGTASVDENGSLVFKDGNKSAVIKLDGTQYQRIENTTEKSSVDISKDKVQVKAADGSSREFKLDAKGEVVSESVIRNGQTETWTRGEKNSDGNYEWKNAQTSKSEIRSSVEQKDGQLKIAYPDGKQYQANTSGEESLENKKQDWSIKYKNGQPAESKFPDGTVRKYTFDKPGESPKAIEVTGKDGSVINITRDSEGVYNYKSKTSEMKWNVNFTVGRDGTYKFVDKDEKGKTTTRSIDGNKIVDDPVNKTIVESYRDSVRKVTKDGKSVELVADEKNQISELKDSASNTSYKKNEKGEWIASALDAKKPFSSDGIARKGELALTEKGTVSFSDSDGRLVRQEPGEKAVLVSSKESTIEATNSNSAMSDADKAAFEKSILAHAKDDKVPAGVKSVLQESLISFAKRTDISDKEKASTYKELSRLLDSKSETVFSNTDKSLLAAQLAWHVGNCSKNAQGENPTCQVTSIRSQLLYESPSSFARMMTDVLTTGQFKTNDGSIIKPPINSLKRTDGSEESRFPPEDGVRTWLGKISDVTVANVHWQRQTVAPSGEVVAKGHLVYRQEPPTGRKDGGHRLYKEPNDGYMYPQNNTDGKLIEQPTMYAKDIADAFNQIIPGGKRSPVVVIQRHDIKTGPGVSALQTEDQLHDLLSKEPGSHITQIWTGADWCWREPARKYNFKPKDETDGEHALIIKDYDPKTKTVAVDNSWSSVYDRVDSSRRISLHELYLAMAKK